APPSVTFQGGREHHCLGGTRVNRSTAVVDVWGGAREPRPNERESGHDSEGQGGMTGIANRPIGALPRHRQVNRASILLALLVSVALPIFAQVPAPTTHPTSAGPTQPGSKIYAQDLVDRLLVRHPELVELDIHATPPNESESVIIASKTPGRIGKKS